MMNQLEVASIVAAVEALKEETKKVRLTIKREDERIDTVETGFYFHF